MTYGPGRQQFDRRAKRPLMHVRVGLPGARVQVIRFRAHRRGAGPPPGPASRSHCSACGYTPGAANSAPHLAAGRLHRGSTRQASEDRPAVAGGTGQDGQVSGGKRDAGDAHVLADMVRTDSPPGRAANLGRARWDDRVAFVDTRDVADVAAAILVEGPGIADTVRAMAPFPSEASWWRGDRAASCPRMARRLRLAGEAEVWAEHRRARLPAGTHVPPGTATSLQQTDMCTVCVAPAALKERRSSRAFRHRPRWDLPRLFAA